MLKQENKTNDSKTSLGMIHRKMKEKIIKIRNKKYVFVIYQPC